jgi:hypothetical protein
MCRYTRPSGINDVAVAPISYGWIDTDESRVVFRRGYLGADASGRPGNFYAHIVIATRDEFPAAEVLRRFVSPFWWTGESVSDRLIDTDKWALPDVSLADIDVGNGHRLESALMVSTTSTLLRERGRRTVALLASPIETISILDGVARQLPGYLDEFSFSTFEVGTFAAAFDIVGVASAADFPNGAAKVQHGGAEPDPIGRLVHSAVSRDKQIVRIALASVRTASDRVDSKRLLNSLELHQAVRDGQFPTLAQVLDLVENMEAVEQTLQLPDDSGHRPAMEVLSRALAIPDHRAWDGLARCLGSLSQSTVRDIGQCIGGELRSGHDARRIDTVLALAARVSALLTKACAKKFMASDISERSFIAAVGNGTRLQLLQEAAASGGSPELIEGLLTSPGRGFEILVESTLPTAWRAKIIAAAIRLGHADGVVLASALRRHPRMASSLAGEILDGVVIAAAAAQLGSPDVLRMMPKLIDRLPGSAQPPVVADVMMHLNVRDRIRFVQIFVAKADSPEAWQSVADDITCAAAKEIVWSAKSGFSRSKDETLEALLNRVGGEVRAAWLPIFASLWGQPLDLPALLNAIHLRRAMTGDACHSASIDLTVIAAYASVRRLDEFAEIVLELTPKRGGGDIARRLIGVRFGSPFIHSPVAAKLALWGIACLINSGKLAIGGFVRSGDLDTETRNGVIKLAGMVRNHPPEWRDLDSRLAGLNDTSRRWWNAVNSEAVRSGFALQ